MRHLRAAGRPKAVAALLFVAGAVAGACSSDPIVPSRNFGPPVTETPDSGVAEDGAAAADGGPGTTGAVSCSNGARDGDESDVDCGGAICPPCAVGRACVAARDCVGLVCAEAKCTNDAGCSDGTREAFVSPVTFPDIAACAGAWSIPGLGTSTPACGRAAGNGSMNAAGKGCSVADLCQVGWRVCETPAAVATRTGGAGCAAAGIAAQNAFYAVRQSGGGSAACGPGTNDLFGCGDVGLAPDAVTCAPLDRFSNDLCVAIPATWACGANGADELNNVTKTASAGGGVLCCRD